ncbi:hypothetical protein B0H14DRAFT_3909405 [Mycena olivaceomarginata]|nr:hypothetical protein B0H14DRAFT_3909405 [Mycena olivaceomarginata]
MAAEIATTVHRPTPGPAPSRAAQRKQCVLETEQPLEDTELEEQAPPLFVSFLFEWSGVDTMRFPSCPASPPPSAARTPYLHPQTLTRDPIRPARAPAPAPAARLPFTCVLPPCVQRTRTSRRRSGSPSHPVPRLSLSSPTCSSRPSGRMTPSVCAGYMSPLPPTSAINAPTRIRTDADAAACQHPLATDAARDAAYGKPKPTRGEEAQSRKRAVPILPVLRPLRIDDADDSAVCHTRAAAAARFRRRAGGRGEDGEMTVIDERDFGPDGEGDEELPMPVPWWSDLLAPRTPAASSIDRRAAHVLQK